jgi:hypothetical protein
MELEKKKIGRRGRHQFQIRSVTASPSPPIRAFCGESGAKGAGVIDTRAGCFRGFLGGSSENQKNAFRAAITVFFRTIENKTEISGF